MRAPVRFAAGALAALAAACGGGGGGSAFSVPSKLALTIGNDQSYAVSFARVQVKDVPDEGVWIHVDHTDLAVHAASSTTSEPGKANVWVYFKAPLTLAPGTYEDTVTVHACSDPDCADELDGSPQTIAVTLTVVAGDGDPPASMPGPRPEPGLPVLPLTDPRALGHNVLDAEYSEALGAIVMIADVPRPALHVYDLATHTGRFVPLDMTPTALSVASNGLSAAVGHDRKITVVNLADLDAPARHLDVSTFVGDLILSDAGFVHVFPRSGTLGLDVLSVEIATNIESPNIGFNPVWAGTRAARHPSGERMYGVYELGIARFHIDQGVAVHTAGGNNVDQCAGVWMDEDGARVFAACGEVFHSSNIIGRELSHAGRLELMPASPLKSRIRSLSHSVERGEVVVLEQPWYQCQIVADPATCFTRLSLYDADLKLAARYTLAPMTVAGKVYAQSGNWIFHSADGTKRYMISALARFPSLNDSYWISEVAVDGPAPVTSTPTVTPSIEPDVAAAPLADVAPVPHDIIDAEYSAALNAIVMISEFPVHALYIHDLATRTERSVALTRLPTSVSVAPDGLHAAVGHNNLVTIVDLAPAGAAAPVLLNTTFEPTDVVMGGNGYVYGMPRAGYEPIRSINIGTGAIALSTDNVRNGGAARLHPSGTKLYGAFIGGSILDLQQYSIDGTTAQVGHRSPYHEDYAYCGNLWLSESGTRIFTACGNTFRASDDPAQDLRYAGALAPAADSQQPYTLASVSESAEAQQIAAIESRSADCHPYEDPVLCRSYLDLYGSAFMTPIVRYSLSPLAVGDHTYLQRGMFAFHNADGSELYVVSRLYGMMNPYAEYYISRVD